MLQQTHVIYARKSTESEDRQVLSIPAQVEELRALALRRGVVPVRVVEESMSAKEPGRPKFQELMREVQAGSLKGILCWKLDRLARNPVDGATLMWALTKKKLAEIITPSRTFSAASDDVLLMNIEFGMARKFIDDLSENVKRGMRARVARGWIPWKPPAGYKPDRDTGTVVKDPIRFPQRGHLEEQFGGWLDRLSLPDSIAAWCEETLEEMAQARYVEREAVRLSRDKARRSIERQLSALTDLRVRNVVGDKQYLERRQDLLLQQEALSQPVRESGVFEPARAVVTLLNQAKNRFLAGGDREKRAIVETVCSNSRLLDGKWLCAAKKPFSILGERPQIPVWSG